MQFIAYTEKKTRTDILQVFHPYIEKLVANMDDMFPDLPVLKNLSILDPSNIEYPADMEYVTMYGKTEVQVK